MLNDQAIRDSRGRMLAPLPGTQPITHANARTLALKRWEKYRREAVQKVTGIIAKEVDPSIETGAQAYAVVLAHHAKLLIQSKQPRIYDVEKLGQLMTGASQESQRGNAGDPPAGVIIAQPATLMELVDILERRRELDKQQARAIEGQAHE